MAERVGFISNVTPEWLDTAFSCAASGKSEANASAALDELISHVFTAKDNIGKSRRVLTTIFYGSDSWILQNALSTGKNMPNAERIPIYLTLTSFDPHALVAHLLSVCSLSGGILGQVVVSASVFVCCYLEPPGLFLSFPLGSYIIILILLALSRGEC